jgi:hypothetical protein
MSGPEEAFNFKDEYRFLHRSYWGDVTNVPRSEKDVGAVRPFDHKLALKVFEAYNQNSHVTGEACMAGYNFFPDNFDPGTMFRYYLERMNLKDSETMSDYLEDEGVAILLPGSTGKGLFSPTPGRDGKLYFEPLAIASEPLIVGWTTESNKQKGNGKVMERLLSLEVLENGTEVWQAEQDRLMRTIRGRLLNFIQTK